MVILKHRGQPKRSARRRAGADAELNYSAIFFNRLESVAQWSVLWWRPFAHRTLADHVNETLATFVPRPGRNRQTSNCSRRISRHESSAFVGDRQTVGTGPSGGRGGLFFTFIWLKKPCSTATAYSPYTRTMTRPARHSVRRLVER